MKEKPRTIVAKGTREVIVSVPGLKMRRETKVMTVHDESVADCVSEESGHTD
jgi:hypothetical protein